MSTSNSSILWFNFMDSLVEKSLFPQAVHRVLFWGPPGTGKSYWPQSKFPHVERVPLHSQTPPDDLVGAFGLDSDGQGGTKTVWADGPAVRAMKKGCPLVLDEIDQLSADVRVILHAVLDDLRSATLTLPTGERVQPAKGFCVIATTNMNPDSIPEALLDRIEIVLRADTPHPEAMNTLDPPSRSLMEAHYREQTAEQWGGNPTFRRALAMSKLVKKISSHEAATAVYGQNGKKIVDTLVSHGAKVKM